MTHSPNFTTASQFLNSIWPEPAGLISIVSLPDPRSWFSTTTEAAAHDAMRIANTHNIYVTTGAYHTVPDSGRGTEEMVSAIPGLWADVDILGKAHKSPNLPRTLDDAKKIIAAAGLEPTLLVHSGHGLQAWWLFKEPWVFDSPLDRRKAKSLSVRWQLMLRQAAEKHGWTIDGTADLCRLLRLPGTLNHKIKNEIVSVRYRESGPRYSITELSERIDDIPEPSHVPINGNGNGATFSGPPANLPPILDQCAWMRHCQDDASTLPEPEWYQMLTIVARCADPDHFAHRLSKPYPQYSITETDAKLRQAAKAPGPVTCRFIETNFGDTKFCLSCKNQGSLNSPILLGRQRITTAIPPDEYTETEATQPAPTTDDQEAILSDIFAGIRRKPSPIADIAFRGIVGDLVRIVEPHTEADRNWLLLLSLTCAGNTIGRTVYIQRGGDHHYTNLFSCAVGTTGVGRKGSAFSPVAGFFQSCDDTWKKRQVSGLSSGEGLIYAVRDPTEKLEHPKGKNGKPDTSQPEELVVTDQGEPDKRLLVNESEFRNALNMMSRDGNSLSPVIRTAWETGNMRSLVKNAPMQSTGAHISLVGNITAEELRSGMAQGDIDNGFANRFLWCWSERSKVLPSGGRLWQVIGSPEYLVLQQQFNRVCYFVNELSAHQALRYDLTPEANDLWGSDGDDKNGLYVYLTRHRRGLLSKLTNRAAPIVLRLSLIFAVLDQAPAIDIPHLDAALEIWRYCEETCMYIFKSITGDKTADNILYALRQSQEKGMTRSQISALFKGNKAATELRDAIMLLHSEGLASYTTVKITRGRPVEWWFALHVED